MRASGFKKLENPQKTTYSDLKKYFRPHLKNLVGSVFANSARPYLQIAWCPNN